MAFENPINIPLRLLEINQFPSPSQAGTILARMGILSENLFDHIPGDIGEAFISSVVEVGQPFMI